MKTNKTDHICIAVRDLEQAKKIWEPVFGKREPDGMHIDEVEKFKVARYYLGDVGFELVESTSVDGDVARFIKRRGEGVMPVSFNVDSIRDVMAELEPQGYPFAGGAPRSGRVSLPLFIQRR